MRLMELAESIDVRYLSKYFGDRLFKLRNIMFCKPPERFKTFKFQYNMEEIYDFKEMKKTLTFDTYSKNDINLLVAFMITLTMNIYVIF